MKNLGPRSLLVSSVLALACATAASRGTRPAETVQPAGAAARHNPPPRSPESDPENLERRFGVAEARARKEAQRRADEERRERADVEKIRGGATRRPAPDAGPPPSP